MIVNCNFCVGFANLEYCQSYPFKVHETKFAGVKLRMIRRLINQLNSSGSKHVSQHWFNMCGMMKTTIIHCNCSALFKISNISSCNVLGEKCRNSSPLGGPGRKFDMPIDVIQKINGESSIASVSLNFYIEWDRPTNEFP